MSKRLERENAQAAIDEFKEYGAPNLLRAIVRRIALHEFHDAAVYLRSLANTCDEMKAHADKLNGGDNG